MLKGSSYQMTSFRMQHKRFEIALIALLFAAGWATLPPQSPDYLSTLTSTSAPGNHAGTKGTGSAGMSLVPAP